MGDAPRAVILAAGQGKRMRSAVPKVLHRVGGRPMLLHAVDAARAATGAPPVVVVSSGQPAVRVAVGEAGTCVEQASPLGTGDALRSLPDSLRPPGSVLVLGGDTPLVRSETLEALLRAHAANGADCTLLVVRPTDPSGLGRVERDSAGRVVRIVEDSDLPAGARASAECNAGVYVFTGATLWPALDLITSGNAQGERYLTDVIELLAGRVEAIEVSDSAEVMGINDRRQLAAAETVLRRRALDALMQGGVTIEDPATTYVDSHVTVGPDSTLLPMTELRGATRLGTGCVVGPRATLRDVRAGDRVIVQSAHLEDCELGDDVRVGPYCRIRPDTVLASGVELGTHAEVKNSILGAGTRISHFSCVLDSDVGRDVNIGAGAVTCNFDGEGKHRTRIGDRVFVGTNATLVAPVSIGDGAYVAAGSFIDHDVPAGALAVGRTRQHNVEGWAARRRGARA